MGCQDGMKKAMSMSMGAAAKGIHSAGVEWVKCGTLRWFRHLRMKENKFVNRLSEVEEGNHQ